MNNSMSLLLLLTFFSLSANAASIRGEIQRYTLLHDRAIVDRSLKSRPYDQFLNVDFIISSGLKELVGDISDGTNDTQSTVQKQLNMFEILSKYVNTEQYVDLDFSFGVPLVKIKIKKFRLYTSAFYHVNLGVMATVSNQESVTNPTAQTYVKKETKTGLNFSFKRIENEYWRVALYQLKRSDLYSVVTSTSLASDGELFDFDKLNDEHQVYSFDLAVEKNYEKYSFLGEVREVKALSSSGQETLFGNRAFLHSKVSRQYRPGDYLINGFIGLHYRKWYSLMRGLYVGFDFKYLKVENLRFLFKMSNQFFVLNPLVEFKYFKFSYSYKSPHRNPQDDIWVPGMHNIALAIPFP